MGKESSKAGVEVELTEKKHYKKYLFLSVVFILIGVLLLFYSKNPELDLISRETWLELLFHVGMAVLISGILILTVEIITRKFHFKRSEILTKKLSEDILATIFEQFTPAEIRDEVINYIFKSDFYYRNYEKEAVVEEASINDEILLKFSDITRVEVHNPTSEQKEYVSPSFLYDIDTIKDLPKPIVNSFQIMDEKHNVLYDFKEESLAKALEKEQNKGQLRVKASCMIPANSHITMRRSDTIFLRRAKDYLDVIITKPTVNFRLTFKFPNSNYKFWCVPNRPGSQEKERFSVRIYEKENRIEAEAKGGLLPYQGLMLQYIYLKE